MAQPKPVLLAASLDKNLLRLNEMFGASADYYAKKLRISGCPAALLFFDNLADMDSLYQVLLQSGDTLLLPGECRDAKGEELFQYLFMASRLPAENQPVCDETELTRRLTAGFAVLLLDGCAKGIALSVQSLKARSVEEPSSEGNIRGSREGFTDLLRTNLSLLRRLVRTETLTLEVTQAATATVTEYAVCYDRAKADPAMIAQLKQRLKQAKPPMLLDSSYFMPWIDPRRLRLFTPAGYTERPAVAAAKICEGKAIVLVNGSPSALILPYLFYENFECLDDYGGAAYFASFLRVLKYCSFLLTVLLPGAFVTVAVFMQELLPAPLLDKIAAAEQGTPLPLFAETLLVILLLELIREASLRMPQSLGTSVSLVAALIIGDAAISTGVLSTPVIIVAAVTSIAMFVTPSLYEPASILRLALLLAGGVAGPIGLAAAMLAVLVGLSEISCLGVPYFGKGYLSGGYLWRDGVLRQNYRNLAQRRFLIRQMRDERLHRKGDGTDETE